MSGTVSKKPSPARGRASGKTPANSGPGRPSQRQVLLDDALDLVAENGTDALTYEALAKRNSISKGGLLYHFPSKVALLEAMTERLIERYADARRKATESLPESPGRALTGYAIASIHNHSSADAASARLKMAGVWNNQAGRLYFEQRFREMREGNSFERTAVVHLAVEGLWFMELTGLSPFSQSERQQVVETLLRLAAGGEIEASE